MGGEAVLLKPSWLKVSAKETAGLQQLKGLARQQQLATVCQSANCPNMQECWSGGTATFMLMGDTCTRGCRFCNVNTGNPKGWLDAEEPQKLAEAVALMGWHYVVLTSVDRDDLPDGGAAHLARCVEALHQRLPAVSVELLAPDFQGSLPALEQVLAAGLRVFAHNVETVEALSPSVRDRRANYRQSLAVLAAAKQWAIEQGSEMHTKSAIMLGLGETEAQLHATLADLRSAGVSMLTIGQYLRPSEKHISVKAYLPPETFAYWRQQAKDVYGFSHCFSAPLVRSSYRAGELLQGKALPL